MRKESAEITYFFRAKNIDYSIERVFESIIPVVSLKFTIKSISVPYFRIRLFMILKNLIFCWKHRSKINHITGVVHYCSLILPYSKTIITIHDMSSVEYEKGLKRFFFWFFFFYLPIKRCKYVTCISESVKESLQKYKCCPSYKLVVIPNPVSDSFIYSPKEFNSGCPRILHVGTRPNKNLPMVIRSLHNIQCHLVIVGEMSNQDVSLLKELEISYTNKINLLDNEILREYLDCDIVSFPSIFEGFGLPIIEGQAIGRPVLTSNISPMKEVSGESYYLINPYSEQDIRIGFLNLINDENLRNEMIGMGLNNVKKYRTEVIAFKYMDLYEKVLNK